MSYHRRRTLDWWEETTALAAGVAAGLAAGYLVRVWLQRDPLPRDGRGAPRGERVGPGAGAAAGPTATDGPATGSAREGTEGAGATGQH